MYKGKYFVVKRFLFCSFSFILLSIISATLYADGSATGSQSPQNPVNPGVNPVYTITVTNLDPSSGVFPDITIQLGGVDISAAFTSISSNCSLDNNIFFCNLLDASTTTSYQFEWATAPLAGDYPLTFLVNCGVSCLVNNVMITTRVLSETEFLLLQVLTESELEVNESLKSACANLTATTVVTNAEAENNLRAACLALENADAATVVNAIRQLTPKQGPAQGTSSIEANNRQFDNIASRMASLRGGVTGISVSGLNLQYAELSLPGSVFDTQSDIPSGDSPLLIGKLGIFINGSVSFGDKASSSNELGFDVDTKGLTFGMDYRFSDKFIAGGAMGYINNKTDFDSNSGGMDVDGYTLSAYSTYYHDENSYLDAIFTVGWNDFNNSRSINIGGGFPAAEIKGDSRGQEYALSVGGGYDFYHDSFSFGPVARINYIRADINSYAESSSTGFELVYGSQNIVSLTSTLGGQLSYAISTPGGIFTPQLLFEWAHEFKNDSRFITASFLYDTSSSPLPFSLLTDDPERNYFNLGVGLSATFAEGKSAFIFYETNLQREDIDLDTFSAGLRLTF